MKNTIFYYYNLNNINISYYKGKILVKSNNNFYLFEKVFNQEEVEEQYNLTKEIDNYYDFILNKENSLFTKYQDNYYVLLKTKQKAMSKDLIINPYPVSIKKDISWSKLWFKRSDFLEYQMKHIINKYKVIDESIDYYIGLIEVAANYLNYNSQEKNDKYYLTHKRINDEDFYNPLNIKVDVKEREIAEYLKYLFLSNKYLEENIEDFLKRLNLSKEGRIKILARLIFPSIYLDFYDKLINEEAPEEELEKFILRNEEYELFIKKIFKILNKKNDMPHIHFF